MAGAWIRWRRLWGDRNFATVIALTPKHSFLEAGRKLPPQLSLYFGPSYPPSTRTHCQPIANMIKVPRGLFSMKKLFTIGYEGANLDDLFGSLRRSGVRLLIDIRDVPISRKRGFSKTALANGLESVGIAYLHLKGLGDPKPGRLAARQGRLADFRTIFGAHMLTGVAQTALEQAISAASRKTTCLLCFEQDHTNCHRSIVASSMMSRTKFSVVHLRANAIARMPKKRPYQDDNTSAYVG